MKKMFFEVTFIKEYWCVLNKKPKIYWGHYFIYVLSFTLFLSLRKCTHFLYNVLTGIVWCIDHEDLVVADVETEVSEDQVEVKVEEFEGWTKPGIYISDITQNILSGLQYDKG